VSIVLESAAVSDRHVDSALRTLAHAEPDGPASAVAVSAVVSGSSGWVRTRRSQLVLDVEVCVDSVQQAALWSTNDNQGG
jgi:hypothetical protein